MAKRGNPYYTPEQLWMRKKRSETPLQTALSNMYKSFKNSGIPTYYRNYDKSKRFVNLAYTIHDNYKVIKTLNESEASLRINTLKTQLNDICAAANEIFCGTLDSAHISWLKAVIKFLEFLAINLDVTAEELKDVASCAAEFNKCLCFKKFKGSSNFNQINLNELIN